MYYGQRRGPEARGFYNPYQKTPDWGAGIRDMLNNFRIMKQYRDEMEQREESSQLARDRFELAKTGQEATAEYRTEQLKRTDRAATEKGRLGGQKFAHERAMEAQEREKTKKERELKAARYQTPEEEAELKLQYDTKLFENKERIKASYSNAAQGKVMAEQYGREVKYIDGGIKKFNTEMKRLRALDIPESNYMQELEVGQSVDRLQGGLEELGMYKAMLQSGRTLGKKESDRVKKLIVGMGAIKSGSLDTETAKKSITDELTDEEAAQIKKIIEERNLSPEEAREFTQAYLANKGR